jgi:hypothetical protein
MFHGHLGDDLTIGGMNVRLSRVVQMQVKGASLAQRGTASERGGSEAQLWQPPVQARPIPEHHDDVDPVSVVVTNIHFQATPKDVGIFFDQRCGNVVRVTILRNAHGMPKGYAYMQLMDATSAYAALQLSGTEFMGRCLKVCNFLSKSVDSGRSFLTLPEFA